MPSNTSWYSGSDGTVGYTVNGITDGVYTSNAVSHGYNTVYDTVTYYHATAIITTGSTVYSNPYTLGSYPAEGTIFVSNNNKITIGVSGVATVVAINHAYSYPYAISGGNYTAYGDAATLTDGDVLYTAQYSIVPAANIPTTGVGTEGTVGYGTFTTNASGVVEATLVDHQYVFTSAGGRASASPLPTTAGGALTQLVYVNRYSNQLSGEYTFRVGGLVYTVDSNGNLGLVASFSGYSDAQIWVNGTQITGAFTEPFTATATCDESSFTMKLSTTGLNIGDKVYKTASCINSVCTDITPEVYTGTFANAGNKYTAAGTGITGFDACNSAYAD